MRVDDDCRLLLPIAVVTTIIGGGLSVCDESVYCVGDIDRLTSGAGGVPPILIIIILLLFLFLFHIIFALFCLLFIYSNLLPIFFSIVYY